MGSPRTPDTPQSGGATAHLYAETGRQARGVLVPSQREACVALSDAMKQATAISPLFTLLIPGLFTPGF